MRPTITGGSGDFAVSKGKEFPETYIGGYGSMVWFIDDVKLRGSPADFPMSHLLPSHQGKSSIVSSVGPG